MIKIPLIPAMNSHGGSVVDPARNRAPHHDLLCLLIVLRWDRLSLAKKRLSAEPRALSV